MKRQFTKRGPAKYLLALAVLSLACLSNDSDWLYYHAQHLRWDSDEVDSRFDQGSGKGIEGKDNSRVTVN